MYKIEKSIPIPDMNKYQGAKSPKYPFAKMSIGESFEIEHKDLTSCLGGMNYRKSRYKEFYVMRKTGEGDKHRIWRTK